MQNSRAIITGISGQDAAYLAQLLLEKGYTVVGTRRQDSTETFWRLEELGIVAYRDLEVAQFQATDLSACQALIERYRPTEIYNLAGQTSAVDAVSDPIGTAEANGMSPIYLLEAVRRSGRLIKVFQAGSSELFGRASEVPQTEATQFRPTSPYGVAKLFAHWSCVNYRELYGVFASSGILFNHESPLRGPEFVTRKIARSLARICLGSPEMLKVGNIDSVRDWGYAKDFVCGMWLCLQAKVADDYVFATNQMHTVREFIELCASAAGFDIQWRGAGDKEVGIDRATGRTLVQIDPRFYRDSEIHHRVGNPAKAGHALNWRPTIDLRSLCRLMVEADIRRGGG